MCCDGTPDPAVQQDINTYISLWRDDPEVNITPVLKQCNLALQVCILCVDVYVSCNNLISQWTEIGR